MIAWRSVYIFGVSVCALGMSNVGLVLRAPLSVGGMEGGKVAKMGSWGTYHGIPAIYRAF